jgi:hypothetical protein
MEDNDPPAPPSHVAPSPPVLIPSIPHGILVLDEFENLKRSIQLLRISQLRYIVRKFSLPASGNKARLLGVVLQLVDAMRHSPVLVQISAEVISLLSQQHEPFTNPLESVQSLTPTSADGFRAPDHPLVRYLDTAAVCGPVLANPGSSSGTFSFAARNRSARYCLSFRWADGRAVPMDLRAEINGFAIFVAPDDPWPTPLDITDLLVSNQANTLSIKAIKTHAPVALSVREYELVAITQLVGDAEIQTGELKGPDCAHEQGAKLADFVVRGIALGGWNCPICGIVVAPKDLVTIKTGN